MYASSQAPQAPQVIEPQIPQPKSHMFQLNFYKKFFDLNTEDFFEKIKNAINPFNHQLNLIKEDDEEITELYGFFWITGTLIFLMFVSSTGSNLLSNWLHSKKDKEYEYNFDLLTISISLFYGYNLIVPFILFSVTTWVLKFPERLSLTKMVSVFGYTNILWFPITIINFLIVLLINNEKHHTLLNILEWIIVSISGVVTGLSNLSKIGPVLLKNLSLIGDVDPQRNYYILMGSLIFAHMIFTVLVKISFFGISV